MRPLQKKKIPRRHDKYISYTQHLTKTYTQNNVHIRKVDNSCLLWGREENYQFIICMHGKSAKV